MAQDKKAAKFFCENCGAEVPQAAKMCRHCGRFFSSVRCPQCGTTGNPDKFSKGCPTCGYAFGTPNTEKGKQIKEKKASLRSRWLLGKSIKERNEMVNGISGTSRGDESLPWWMYIAAIFCLGIMILLFTRFFL